MQVRSVIRAVVLLVFVVESFAVGASKDAKPMLRIDAGGHMGGPTFMAFTPDGRYLVTSGQGKAARIRDLRTGAEHVTRPQIGETGWVGKLAAAALSPGDDAFVLSGAFSHRSMRLLVVDVSTGRLKTWITLPKGCLGPVAMAFSPDGRWLALGNQIVNADIVMLERRGSNAWELVRTLKEHNTGQGYQRADRISFAPTGDRFASSGYDRSLRLWRRTGGTWQCHYRKKGFRAGKSFNYSPDGRLLAWGEKRNVVLCNADTGEIVRSIECVPEGHGNAGRVAFAPDGRRLLVGTLWQSRRRVSAFICSVSDGRVLATFGRHRHRVTHVAWSPDGQFAATSDSFGDIYVWRAATGEMVHDFSCKAEGMRSIAWARDGRRAVAFGRRTMQSWDEVPEKRPLHQSFDLSELALADITTRSATDSDEWQRGVRERDGWSLKLVGQPGHDGARVEIQEHGRAQRTIQRDYHRMTWAFLGDQRVAIVSSRGELRGLWLWDAKSGSRVRQFTGALHGYLDALAPSPDDRFLAAARDDGTVLTWNVETGEPLLSLFVAKDREWVAWTPEGYYACSVQGDQYIGWHVNQGPDKLAKFYRARQFAKQFHRPDIVRRVIETGDTKEAIRLANKAPGRTAKKQIKTADIARHEPPEVAITSPKDGAVVDQTTVRVVATVRATAGNPVERVTILVNGKPIDATRGFAGVATSESATTDGATTVSQDVTLSPGENIIGVVAANAYSTSAPQMIAVTCRMQDVRKPDLYVLAIGVSEYKNPQYNLKSAHADAEAIADALKQQQGKLFGRAQARVLTNQKASRGDILDGVDWLLKETTQRDLAIMFIAGHGKRDSRGNYYFLPHEADIDRLRRTGVPWTELQSVLADLPSKRLLFVDTCHAGAVTGARTRSADSLTDAIRDLIADEVGAVVMAASTGRELSHERDDWGHGAFTKALLEGFEGKADYNGDGAVYLTELDAYVTDRVKALTKGAQHPTTNKPSTVRSFPIVSTGLGRPAPAEAALGAVAAAAVPTAQEGPTRLVVQIEPPGATVLVDGKSMELKQDGRVLFTDVTPGSHMLDVRKEGYAKLEKLLAVPAGGMDGKVKLAALRQIVTLHTKSGGKLDGELVSRTDESITFLWRGKRKMTLPKAQCARVELGKAEPQAASTFEAVRALRR